MWAFDTVFIRFQLLNHFLHTVTGDKMVHSDCLCAIKAELSVNAKVLSEPSAEEFKTSLEHWTELDHKTPDAIVFPATEEDIVKIVSFAINPTK